MAKIIRSTLQKAGLYNQAMSVHRSFSSFRHWWSVKVALPILKRSNLLRKIHYVLFSSLFDHEMKMFVHARHNYLSSKDKNNNPVLLRRLIHQLEKD